MKANRMTTSDAAGRKIPDAGVAGSRRGVLEACKEVGGGAGGVYVAEGTAAARGGVAAAPWFELIAVGCRGSSEAARKYNLLQTVRIVSSSTAAAGGAAVEEGLRAILDSFELTAGKTCAPP